MLINAYATHADPPPLAFPHKLNARRDWRDPALANHLAGLREFLYQRITKTQGPSPKLSTQQQALDEHVQRVRSHLSFHVDSEHMDQVARWAMAANAVLFFEDTTVRDPFGRVLSGEVVDSYAEVPRLTHGLVRKQASIAALQARGVLTLDWLPALAADPEVVLRSPLEIADRVSSLLVVAVRGEALRDRTELSTDTLRERLPHAFVTLTPTERAFLADPMPDDQTVTNFVWRYECLPVLLWALDLHPALAYPTTLCDVPLAISTVFETSHEDLTARAHVRSVAEILDQADFLYRLHWAVVNARVQGTEAPADVQAGVVVERSHALEWLIDADTEWDDIQLTT